MTRRNLVFCADGTCNAFGHSSSNVSRLLQHIELQDASAQLVCYDQGIGTNLAEFKRVKAFREQLGERGALYLLEPPREAWSRPWTWRSLISSMTHGSGLDTNVAQLYEALATQYSPADRVFLFGFSRGAFTVRALAGFAWRYGLPSTNDATDAKDRFAEAWPLFVNEFPDEDGAKAMMASKFRKNHGQRDCSIHFLGLWDTVKSYGGLKPIALPHLRHNPSVRTVRHAMALHESRAWFEVTTWGWLDSDREDGAAKSRLEQSVIDTIQKQDVVEVWFSGSHSDVGGGRGHNASVAFRWMLGEAQQAELKLNAAGRSFLLREDESVAATESRTFVWKAIETIQRRTIDNGGRWPESPFAPRGASPRKPWKSARGRSIWHHESVTDLSGFEKRLANVTLELKRRCTLRPRP